MGLFSYFFKRLGKKDSFEVKDKCDFCDEPFHNKPIKVLSFSFIGDNQYQCCQRCFKKASKNDMRIISPRIVKDYISKEGIEYAADPRLKNFFGFQVHIDGMWITINSFMFFARSEIDLPMNPTINSTNHVSSIKNDPRPIGVDDSSFWTSFVVAELTHSPFVGYLAGGSLLGGLLGSNISSSSDSFFANDTSSYDGSSHSSFTSSSDFFSTSSWSDSSSDSCSSFGDSGGSCGGSD